MQHGFTPKLLPMITLLTSSQLSVIIPDALPLPRAWCGGWVGGIKEIQIMSEENLAKNLKQ